MIYGKSIISACGFDDGYAPVTTFPDLLSNLLYDKTYSSVLCFPVRNQCIYHNIQIQCGSTETVRFTPNTVVVTYTIVTLNFNLSNGTHSHGQKWGAFCKFKVWFLFWLYSSKRTLTLTAKMPRLVVIYIISFNSLSPGILFTKR